ncbi:hypothetical protein F2P81_014116 [Scophthalmus maximus]|uniref:Uncharacterized protein n=1 Tax=Scophthalmus maximus TaxID=52904 RepID=A0A6A4SQ98_SCOMX|nr:hypothetical protein F2P81_014116 [Scophthalmus maximus]
MIIFGAILIHFSSIQFWFRSELDSVLVSERGSPAFCCCRSPRDLPEQNNIRRPSHSSRHNTVSVALWACFKRSLGPQSEADSARLCQSQRLLHKHPSFPRTVTSSLTAAAVSLRGAGELPRLLH